jgi:hemolysin D
MHQLAIDRTALDFAPAILAVQEKPPSPLPRTMLYLLLSLFGILLGWAVLGKVDVVAVAEGKLVPQSYLKIVQPADSGIVKDILVKEGDLVKEHQVLMRLDPKLSEADTRIVEGELQQKKLQLRRIEAELAGSGLLLQKGDDAEAFRQVLAQYHAHRQAYDDAAAQERALLAKAREDYASARQVNAKLKRVLPAYQETEQAWNQLHQEGFAGKLLALDKQRQRKEAEGDLKAQEESLASYRSSIEQSEKRLAQITSNYKQQLHNEQVDVQGQLQKLEQELAKQRHRAALLELKAPQAGKIKDLATHTLGTVVSPGTILLSLIPIDEPLKAEVMIQNDDVGFVKEGQPVKLKLAAYPFQKYGMVEGTVTHVSADATEVPNGKPADTPDGSASGKPQATAAYKAIVTLKAQQITARGERFTLSPGMQVVAEINQGTRTILDYLLSPVQGVFHEAGRER